MIEFTYKINDFLNNAQIISMYRANAILQHSSPDVPIALEDTATTYEDDAIITNYLKKGAAELAGSLSGYAQDLFDVDGITPKDAIEFTEDTQDAEAQIIIRITLPITFNNSLLLPIDEAIKDALENYVLYRLYKAKGHNFESFLDDYSKSTGNILMYLNQRSKSTHRSYRMF